jgi:hemolysin-activating ACP:hemolysin acyltransferase
LVREFSRVTNQDHSPEAKNLNGAANNGAETAPETAAAMAAPSTPDPALAQKLAAFRQHLQTAFAKVVMTMMATPRYKHCSITELEQLVLDPLLRNHVAIAQARPKDGAAPSPDDPFAGIAIWAKVSPEVNAKIREQIAAKVFPIRLKAEDWASGDITWLLDVIAPNPKLATAVVANFRQGVKEGQLFAHPIVRDLIDPALVKAKPAEAEAEAEAAPGAN